MRTVIIVAALLALASATAIQAAVAPKAVFVCDAGSSGTRVYGFKYTPATANADGSAPAAIIPIANATWVLRVQPGAATFSTHPQDLAAYLEPLFVFARKVATDNGFVVAETPLYIGATAGFRLLSDSARESLIGNMRTAVAASGFKFTPADVRIISGTEEGLLAFLATNVVTQRLGVQSALPVTAATTAGVLDMGGASLQIAFQTPKTIMMNEFTFPYRQSSVSLYSYSFLGFGQDEFHRRLNNRIVRDVAYSAPVTRVTSGCYNAGYSFNHTVTGTTNRYEITGTGVVADCITLLDEMNRPSATDCMYGDNQCSIGCAYQPTVPENMVFYATASFYFVVSGLFSPAALASNNEISLDAIWAKTQEVCAMEYSAIPANGNINKQRMCYQGAWFISLLHHSMGFSLTNTHMRFANTVNGIDIAWPLGMAINEVNKASHPVIECPAPVTPSPEPEEPEHPTPTPLNGNVVINFANMFNGIKICNE